MLAKENGIKYLVYYETFNPPINLAVYYYVDILAPNKVELNELTKQLWPKLFCGFR